MHLPNLVFFFSREEQLQSAFPFPYYCFVKEELLQHTEDGGGRGNSEACKKSILSILTTSRAEHIIKGQSIALRS